MRGPILMSLCAALFSFTSAFFTSEDGEATLIQICERPYVNGTITSVIYGNIESPAYPDRYLGVHDCTVTVEIPSMSWIGIYIYEDFQIDRLSNDTCDDFVSISSPNDDSEVVEKCGSVQPSTLLFSKSSDASKEAVDVRFHSVENQRSSTQERFSITYKVADIIYPGWNNNHHRQAILNNVGYVVSHYGFTGKPEDTYGPNINSTLILTGFEPNTYVELYFASLSIHLDAECTDSLTIGGILMVDFREEYPGPLRICNSDQNNVIMYVKTVGTSMSFAFMTGPRGAKSGFLIQYRMTDSPSYDDTTNEFTSETISPPPFTTPSEKTGKGKVTQEPGKDTDKTDLIIYIAVGVGGNILVAVIIAVVIVVVKKNKSSCCGKSSKGMCEVSANGTGRNGSAHTTSDDESAYYSEVGTYQKPGAVDLGQLNTSSANPNNNIPNGGHYYSSRAVGNFYHEIERAPPLPTSHPIFPPPTSPPILTPPPTGRLLLVPTPANPGPPVIESTHPSSSNLTLHESHMDFDHSQYPSEVSYPPHPPLDSRKGSYV